MWALLRLSGVLLALLDVGLAASDQQKHVSRNYQTAAMEQQADTL